MASALTLEETVQLAINSHPTVLAAKAGQTVAAEEIDQARAGYFPTVDSRLSAGLDNFNNQTTRFRRSRGVGEDSTVRTFHQDASVTVTQMVFDGFETPNRVDAAKARLDVRREQVLDAEQVIALRAIEAFFEVERRREVVVLAEENVSVHIEVVEDVTMRAETGAGARADVLQAESRLALAQTRLIQQQGQLHDAEADFLEAVGVLPDDLIVDEPPSEAIPPTMYDAILKAFVSNPTLLAASEAVRSRRHDAAAAEGVFVPRLDLEITGAQEKNVNGVRLTGNNLSALFVMRYNWYRGGGDSARLRGAREQVSQTLMQEQQTRRLIEQQVRTDWNRLETTRAELPNFEDRMVNAAQVVSAYRQQFELGQRTLLDVLDTENELFQARVDVVEVEFDIQFAHWALLASTGEIMKTLGITSETPPEFESLAPDAPLLFLGK